MWTRATREPTMDRDAVIHHLRAWADGIDPASGSTLPADHPAQRPDTLRVLFAALAILHGADRAGPHEAATRAAAARPGARNAGRPWSPEEDEALANAFDSGTAIGSLAAQLERTGGAITARLVKLGKMEPPAGLRLRGFGSDGIPPSTR
jgi:hypothetical protein